MNGFILNGAGLLAAGVTFVTNWLALIPWRRSKDKHWSEQARLYEDNLLPAVTEKGRPTHPDLYDRILATGGTPDFPRPAAASSIALHGVVFAALTGMLFAAFAINAMRVFGAAR